MLFWKTSSNSSGTQHRITVAQLLKHVASPTLRLTVIAILITKALGPKGALVLTPRVPSNLIRTLTFKSRVLLELWNWQVSSLSPHFHLPASPPCTCTSMDLRTKSKVPPGPSLMNLRNLVLSLALSPRGDSTWIFDPLLYLRNQIGTQSSQQYLSVVRWSGSAWRGTAASTVLNTSFLCSTSRAGCREASCRNA